MGPEGLLVVRVTLLVAVIEALALVVLVALIASRH